uniref:Uncharacterized protein n=1 Tax=Anguilla anguilla TaxID=7936 RepID=A0A0E9WR54_ANGAN
MTWDVLVLKGLWTSVATVGWGSTTALILKMLESPALVGISTELCYKDICSFNVC